jgi:hypothetical protein
MSFGSNTRGLGRRHPNCEAAEENRLRSARIGSLGYLFPGMGDFDMDTTHLAATLGCTWTNLTVEDYINRTNPPFHFNRDGEPPGCEAAYTLFMYEDLRAIKKACTEIGIAGREEIGMIFHANTDRLIAGILDRKQKAAPK